jgi:peptidoglycan DL-endopeptidase CwlO
MTGTRARSTRLIVAALLVVPTTLVSVATVSTAAPSQREVQRAKARLDELHHELEIAIERYNDAEYRLTQVQGRLAEAKARKAQAEAEAAQARARLSDRAVEAYTAMGSHLDVLLNASNFTEFSDRLEFMGAISRSDAELAAEADAAGQRAEWAEQEYLDAAGEAKSEVGSMEEERGQIEAMLDEQAELYETLDAEYQDYVEAQRLAAQQAAEAERRAQEQAEDPTPSEPDNSGETGGDDGGGFVPPPNASGAQIAIAAARAVIGTPYVWGSANPGVGLDCSGLTSYAWAQAGVYLPHSAAAQFSSLPHVPLSQVQPGDIIWYNSVSAHVALYIGGGQIIHARHPGPGGQVQLDSLHGYDTPLAAMRPSS